jgi:hypothetical protein
MFFVSFTFANAQIVINEVMYDLEGSDAGREWIEVENSGTDSVDVSGWKFFENETNHGLTLIQGNAEISSGGFAVISDNSDKFLTDWPSFSGILFDSSFSLKNTGELISIRDADLNDIDSLTYDTELGAGGDGDSLQLISGSWSADSPTPGSANPGSGGEESQQQEEGSELDSGSSGSSATSQGSSFPIEQRIFASAGEDRSAIVGADSLFEGRALGLQKKPLLNARYLWNFGNGETKEGQNVLHFYKYPGEYAVVLNVSSGEYSASDRIVVNAFPAELIISKVEKDFIEIHNKLNRELNLSWWRLRSGSEEFSIPKDTIILPNKKLIFSFDVTGLDTSAKENISLLYPNGVIVVSFSQIEISQESTPAKAVEAEPQLSQPQPTIIKTDPSQEKKLKENSKNLSQNASIITSLNNQDKNSGISKWLLAILGIVIVSAGSVIFAGYGKKEDEIKIIE